MAPHTCCKVSSMPTKSAHILKPSPSFVLARSHDANALCARPRRQTSAASLFILCLAQTCYGDVLFSTLPQTLVISASPTDGQVLKVGEDSIRVTWGLNQSFPEGTDAPYNEVKLKLCYAPISQEDRGWRKTVDNLSKDRTSYGQTTDTKKSTNLFKVQAISGRHLSVDIASICFSAFALLSAVGFFLVERRGKNAAKN
ncbi:hypothetical protein DH2020_027069 [Rehmannia glutinosa]|uniref:Uncharacterized protein n=1 Tax=Rehmannia glutinosa TaxID=99300 RepID=A0ABR0VV69_REHGL